MARSGEASKTRSCHITSLRWGNFTGAMQDGTDQVRWDILAILNFHNYILVLRCGSHITTLSPPCLPYLYFGGKNNA